MTYETLLHKLYSVNLRGGVKLGLDSMRSIANTFDNPHQKFQSVHVAGSNGKGTVSAKIAKGLEFKHKKVALFTSPHISSFRERIRINGEMISQGDLERLLGKIIDLPGTFFELTTLLAFLYFVEQGVDVAVLETGLGGRLDATNIVTPLLSVITSISLEHTDILGSTLEEIAREKAGIIKPGVPVVLGPRASFIPYPEAFRVNGVFKNVDEENRAIAKEALQLLKVEEHFIQKALTTRLPCRLERIAFHDKDVILDVAHNPDALRRLFDEIKIPKKELNVVCGLSSNKDLESCLQIIGTHAAHIHLVRSPNSRGAPVEHLMEILLRQGIGREAIHPHTSIVAGMHQATQSIGQTTVIGTFFIMSEARRFLGFEEPCDPFDLNESFGIKLL